MNSQNEKLAVVMPVYNEEGCVDQTLTEWIEALQAMQKRPGAFQEFILIAVDDGSKDNSPGILDGRARETQALRVMHIPNGGHGPAIMKGYAEGIRLLGDGPHTWIFQIDSDGQCVPEDFWPLWQRRKDQWMVAGHRKVRHDPGHRLNISLGLKILLEVIFGVQCPDANVPFRLMRADFVREVIPWIPKACFCPNILITIMAKISGRCTDGIPIQHLARSSGKVSIMGMRLLKACVKSAWQVLHFRATMLEWKSRLNEKLVTSSSEQAHAG